MVCSPVLRTLVFPVKPLLRNSFSKTSQNTVKKLQLLTNKVLSLKVRELVTNRELMGLDPSLPKQSLFEKKGENVSWPQLKRERVKNASVAFVFRLKSSVLLQLLKNRSKTTLAHANGACRFMKNKELGMLEWFFDLEWYKEMLFWVFSTFLVPLKIGVWLGRDIFLDLGYWWTFIFECSHANCNINKSKDNFSSYWKELADD